MESELESIIRHLVAQSKFRINENHILNHRGYRGFSIEEVRHALKNGFLYKLQKPHRALWGYSVEPSQDLIVLSLWILDEHGEFALDWHKSGSMVIDLIYVKTAYRKALS